MAERNRWAGLALAAAVAAGLTACNPQGETAHRAAAPTAAAAGKPASAAAAGPAAEEDFEQVEARADAACGSARGPEPKWAATVGAVAPDKPDDCDAVALYYGIGGPSDPVRARQCALATVAEGLDPGLYGNGVLINVHANGRGGLRDLDLAIRYACDDGIASAFDRARRVNHLLDLKAGRATGKPFDYCDDATSDYSVGQCMNIEIGRAAEARTRRYAALTANWPADRKAAFAALERTEDALAEERSEEETAGGGTDRFIIGRSVREATYVDSLKLFEQATAGRLPAAEKARVAQADADLNTAYRALRASDVVKDLDGAGAEIRPGQIRATQRAWLKYRDAWLALSRLAWPGSTDALAVSLTEARTHQLKCLPDPSADGCN